MIAHAEVGVGRKMLIALYQSAEHEARQGAVASGASQVWRFVNDFQNGYWGVTEPFAPPVDRDAYEALNVARDAPIGE
ncbi:hypothetical protein D3C85_1275540 [compost metagenome]